MLAMITVLATALAVGSPVWGAEATWPDLCVEFARIPLVCREESPPPPDTGTLPTSLTLRLRKTSAERAVALLDSVLHSDKSSATALGAAYLARGSLLAAQDRPLEALCDCQAAVARSAVGARPVAFTLLQRITAEEAHAFEQLDAANRRSAAALASSSAQLRTRLQRLSHEWRVEHVAHSTAIEGNRMEPTHVRALLETGVTQEGQSGTPLREINEVQGTDMAFRYLMQVTGYGSASAAAEWLTGNASAASPSIQLLQAIHRRVLLGGAGCDAGSDCAGQWRTLSVRVADHVAPPAEEVPSMMAELEQRWSSPAFAALHPVEQAALAHFELVWVHPFEDGNGRTARLLSSYLLLRRGYAPLNLRLEHQQRYYDALKASHPAAGGCTRALVDLFRGRVARLQEELVQTLTSTPRSNAPAPVYADAEIAMKVRADGDAAEL